MSKIIELYTETLCWESVEQKNTVTHLCCLCVCVCDCLRSVWSSRFIASLLSDVSSDEHAAGSNLQHLSAGVCVCLCLWLWVIHHGPGEAVIWPLMCKQPAELIHTFWLHLQSASVTTNACCQICKISDFFLRLRCKSLPALLMNPFVSLVLDRQLPSIMVWSHGLISRAEGF